MEKKIRILIIDDEPELVFPLADRLEMRGFDVSASDNWAEALKFFDNKRFDIALLDVKLPGISGIELMKLVFQLQPGIKVIFMSGHGTDDEFVNCKKGGACDLLIKPIDINKLIEKINYIIEFCQK